MKTLEIAGVLALLVASTSAQPPQFGTAVRGFISHDAPVIALTNVRVIDGTGAPPRERQTIVIRSGNIAALGDAATVTAPAGATIIDLSGRTVIPGLIMAHEHLYYLGREGRIGTVAVGKQADLVVVEGNPAADIAEFRKVELVFKQGIGFDPQKLIESVRGRVGLW